MPIHTESAVAVPVAFAGAKASKSNIVTYRLTWRDQLPINPPAYDLADDYVVGQVPKQHVSARPCTFKAQRCQSEI